MSRQQRDRSGEVLGPLLAAMGGKPVPYGALVEAGRKIAAVLVTHRLPVILNSDGPWSGEWDLEQLTDEEAVAWGDVGSDEGSPEVGTSGCRVRSYLSGGGAASCGHPVPPGLRRPRRASEAHRRDRRGVGRTRSGAGCGDDKEIPHGFRGSSAGAAQHRVIWVTPQRNDPLLGRSSHPRPRNALVRGPSCSRESGCTSSSSTARSSRPAYATPAHASRRWSATANGTLFWMPAATTAPNWSARWGRT
jgi:hypothetical protein